MPASSTSARARGVTGWSRAIAAVACVTALCPLTAAAAAPNPGSPPASVSPTPRPAASPGPPPLRASSGSVSLAFEPYTSCWSSGSGGMCYDGIPVHPLPSLGATWGPIDLSFARDRWHFQVSVVDDDGDRERLRLRPTGPREWRLVTRSLPGGHYSADVFGRGPQGDVAGSFAFTLRQQGGDEADGL